MTLPIYTSQIINKVYPLYGQWGTAQQFQMGNRGLALPPEPLHIMTNCTLLADALQDDLQAYPVFLDCVDGTVLVSVVRPEYQAHAPFCWITPSSQDVFESYWFGRLSHCLYDFMRSGRSDHVISEHVRVLYERIEQERENKDHGSLSGFYHHVWTLFKTRASKRSIDSTQKNAVSTNYRQVLLETCIDVQSERMA